MKIRLISATLILLSSLGAFAAPSTNAPEETDPRLHPKGKGWRIERDRSALRAATIEEDFQNPPLAVRPYVWWHWMGGNVSREGITKDLEAMKASGIGGATIFNMPSGLRPFESRIENPPWPGIAYRSPKYWEMVEFATAEAKRLGLELGMHNCIGYSATGGPWITPELSMQKLVFSTTAVNGPAEFAGVLPQPAVVLQYYRDIAVVAVPAGSNVPASAVVDLSARMDKESRLTWEVPPGSWIVYRFGHAMTGSRPAPCPEDVKDALECDKMSPSACRFHFEQVIGPLQQHLGGDFGKTFRHLTLDSYEAGAATWTPLFREEFRKRKGYDPVPRLPGLDGRVVQEGNTRRTIWRVIIGSEDENRRFKWDFDDVVRQLYHEACFAQGARLMEQSGVQMNFEPYGGPFDTMDGAAVAQIPMGEFWTGGGGGIQAGIVPAARAAGRRIVGAEAFTGRPLGSMFTEDPAFLKTAGDGTYAGGVNRLVLHSWVHQPFGDAFKPGYSLGGWGTHFGRNQTWAEPGKAYFQYLGRTQAMLQRGEGIGDFLSLDFSPPGADAITRTMLLRGDVRVENRELVLPSGRRYPFLALPPGEQMLPEVARKLRELVHAGAVIVGPKPSVSPGLSGFPACDDEVRRLADELWDGGKIFGGSLAEYLKKSGFTPLIGLVGNASVLSTGRRDGDTEIFFLANSSKVPCQVTPSFRVRGKQPEIWNPEDGSHFPTPLWRDNAGHIEVPLTLGARQSLFVIFRNPVEPGEHPTDIALGAEKNAAPAWTLCPTAGGKPVLLFSRAVNGEILFSSGKRQPVAVVTPRALPVEGAWEVSFAPGMGAPERITFPKLASWSESADPGVKYFSGTAVYRKAIEVPADLLVAGNRWVLNLGEVGNLASVTVNGVALGVCWYGPFTRDITRALKPGRNELEIAVTNTWANRLIGDEQEPPDMEWKTPVAKLSPKLASYAGTLLDRFPEWFVKGQPRPSKGRKTFCTWNYFAKDSPLYPAGLIGPVVLEVMPSVQLIASKAASTQPFQEPRP